MPLRVDSVAHGFADHDLFHDVTFSLVSGTTTAITGPSGCGKSTLLGIIAGMVEPRAGTVVRSPETSIRWVFQNPHGIARRTALDHVSLPVIARGASRRDADGDAMALLADFGLRERADVPFMSLSGGEAQRLMLARAVAAAPDVLLVDEPTAQLDRRTAAQVNEVIRALAGRGAAVAIATHDTETRDVCDHVVEIAAR